MILTQFLPASLGKRLALLALALLVLAVVLGFFIRSDYATRQAAERTFSLAEDFTKVRKILVRTDGAKQIVTMAGDSEFVSQKWSGGDVDLGTFKLLDPDWKLQLDGTLRVKSKDDYIGQPELALKQSVEIVPDFLDSQVKLAAPTDRLRDYAMTTRFDRDEKHSQTTVQLTLAQEIVTKCPWWAHGIADRRVRAAAEKSLANQEAAIRKLIEDNKDKNWLFPLK